MSQHTLDVQDQGLQNRLRDVLIIAGPSGCGKSTVARLLSQRLGWVMLEGDDFHSQQNIDKMRSGIALTDEDRWPWLAALRAAAVEHVLAGKHVVIACSALKRSYRDFLRGSMFVKQEHRATEAYDEANEAAKSHNLDVAFVLLDPPEHWLKVQTEERAARGLHYMPSSLLLSQLATLQRGQPEEWLCHITSCNSIQSCAKTSSTAPGPDDDGTWPSADQILECILQILSTHDQGFSKSHSSLRA